MPVFSSRPSHLRGVLWLLMPLALTGCAQAAASIATAVVLPRVSAEIAERRQPKPAFQSTPDRRLGWRRAVLTADGRTFDPRRYQDGQTIRVQWTVPVAMPEGAEALVAVADRQCGTGSTLAPVRWRLVRGTSAPAGLEAWGVSPDFQAGRNAAGAPQIGLYQANALEERLQVPSGVGITYLLIVPTPGAYLLELTWEGADASRLMTVTPCIGAWSAVPLALAIEATSRTAPPVAAAPLPDRAATRSGHMPGAPSALDARPAGAATVQVLGERPTNTSDAGISLGADGSVRSADGEAAIDEGGARRALGLLGVPEYDLVRLHQAVVAYDVSLMGGAPSGPLRDPAVQTFARAFRNRALTQLRGGDVRSFAALCELVTRQGLAARTSTVWGDEATVPESDRQRCDAARGTGPGAAIPRDVRP